METTNKKRFAIDWPLIMGDRRKFEEVRALGRALPGVIVLDADGTAEFMDEDKLRQAGEAAVTKEEYTAVRDLFERAKKCPHKPYDPITDAVVYFEDDATFLETLSDRKAHLAKAWWCRPAVRSVRHVNLEDTDDELMRFGLGK